MLYFLLTTSLLVLVAGVVLWRRTKALAVAGAAMILGESALLIPSVRNSPWFVVILAAAVALAVANLWLVRRSLPWRSLSVPFYGVALVGLAGMGAAPSYGMRVGIGLVAFGLVVAAVTLDLRRLYDERARSLAARAR